MKSGSSTAALLRVHGIAGCDSCRKARTWLAGQGVDFEWIDLRRQPPGLAAVERWLKSVGPEALVNRRSTTWRQLPEERRPALTDPDLAGFLVEYPTLIKRPLFEIGRECRAGFDEKTRKWLTPD